MSKKTIRISIKEEKKKVEISLWHENSKATMKGQTYKNKHAPNMINVPQIL